MDKKNLNGWRVNGIRSGIFNGVIDGDNLTGGSIRDAGGCVFPEGQVIFEDRFELDLGGGDRIDKTTISGSRLAVNLCDQQGVCLQWNGITLNASGIDIFQLKTENNGVVYGQVGFNRKIKVPDAGYHRVSIPTGSIVDAGQGSVHHVERIVDGNLQHFDGGYGRGAQVNHLDVNREWIAAGLKTGAGLGVDDIEVNIGRNIGDQDLLGV